MALSTSPPIWKILLFIIVLLTSIIAALFYFKTLFITFIIGICLILIAEFSLDELKRFTRKKGLPDFLPKYIFTTLFFLSFVLLSFIFWRSLMDVLPLLQSNNGIYKIISDYIPLSIEKLFTFDLFQQSQNYFLSLISSFLTNLTSLIATGFLMIPLMFYFYFKKWPKLNLKIASLIPKKFHRAFNDASKKISSELKDFFTAKLIESIVIAIICSIGFFFAGLNGWLVLGLFAGFINIVPYFGPILGAIPALFVGLLTSPNATIIVGLTILVAQLLDNLYMVPFMISKKVSLDPLLSIILILIASKLLGSLGMILAIPMFLIYKTVLQESYRELKKIYG